MPRIKLIIAYTGSGFAGWQVQAPVQGRPQRTVQGVLEDAVASILGTSARLHASGRTDSGVHADRQCAHFDAPPGSERINWREALNGRLPGDISILEHQSVPDDFHARFSVKSKIYTYSLWLEQRYIPPRIRPFAWACGPLDLERMDRAAAELTGLHDFAAFRNSGAAPGDSVREIYSITRFALPLPGAPDAAGAGADGPLVAYRFTGNGFLKQMVRNLVGFMAAAGRGRLEPEDAARLLRSKSRTFLDFPTAPPWGLSLTDVVY